MAVDHDRRPMAAGLRTVEARRHMHRSAEAMRASAASGGGKAGGGGRGAALVARPEPSGWGRGGRAGAALWRHIGRFAGPPLRAMQSRWLRGIGIGIAAVAAIVALVAGGLWLTLASG